MKPKRTSSTVLRAALALCLGGLLPARAAEKAPPSESIPTLAKIGGVTIGSTTREHLETQWGGGKPLTGGHPNGARLWRVKGTDWIIYADAFQYDKKGIVLDFLDLSTKNSRGDNKDIPFAKVSSSRLVWLGKVSPGMSEADLLAFLKTKSLPVEKTDHGWSTTAKGFHSLQNVNKEEYRTWTAQFDIERGLLVGLSLDAR
jgi:hypothetical protein